METTDRLMSLTRLPDVVNPPSTQRPTNLIEVLAEVHHLETCISKITRFYVPTCDIVGSNQTPVETQPTEPFEKIFTKVLPRIDESLSVTEDLIFTINQAVTQIELESIP